MKSDFGIPEIISSLLILVNLYIISVLPLGYLIKDSIFFIQIGFFLLFVVTKLDVVALFNFKPQGNKLIYYSEILLGIVFLIITLVVSLNNNSEIKSVVKIFTYVLLFIMFFNFYASSLISNYNFFNKFVDAIIIFALINSIIGWFAVFFMPPPVDLYQGYHLGLFHHPNTNAAIYSIAVPAIFYKVVYLGKKNYQNIIILVFFFVSMLFTYSRSTFVGVGVALLLITLFRSKKYAVFFILLILLVGVSVLDTFLLAKGGFSSISRLLLFYTAFEMILASTSSVLFGYGVFRSLEIFFTEKLFTGSTEVVVDPHNMILLLGIQFGMIITIAFIGFIILVLVSSISKVNKLNPEIKSGVVLSFSMVINLVVQNQFEDIIIYPEYFVYPVFLVFLGYLYHSYRFKRNDENI